MKGFGEHYKSKNKSNKKTKPPKEQIINQAMQLHLNGNIPEAAKYYQYCINQGFDDPKVFSNYAGILRLSGKLKEAEVLLRKAIELNPEFPKAHANLGSILYDLDKLKDAELSFFKAIELNPKDPEAHCNLGKVLSDLGKLEEAELSCLKAIELNPNYSNAHSNLGNVLSRLGKLEEAELSQLKAIELNPNYVAPYFSLSTLKYSDENTIWKNQLFSENILNKKSNEDKINIYFARANILHREKNYEESSKFLKFANQLKLTLHPSNSNTFINKSKKLLAESIKQEINQKKHAESPESIFIVGMPRSGSTLLESILSMNAGVDDLGECDFLEKSYLECKTNNQVCTIAERYWKKIKDHKKQSHSTTNKNLYNYQYAGIIAKKIPNSKIIHCYRNPLDNILSIYRAHFKGNQYSSSLVDVAKVYLDQEELMNKYKNKFRSKIYDLNYDLLVTNPKEEIKSLISWLGWKWEDKYLSPHLNPRSVSTASKVQVRSPINSKSIGGWKNYKEMLRPAIEIITKVDKYRNLVL